jgi:hypothetical protein
LYLPLYRRVRTVLDQIGLLYSGDVGVHGPPLPLRLEVGTTAS